MMKIFATTAAFALIAGSAFAGTPAAPVGYDYAVVKLADLDRLNPTDAKRLEHRLTAAALQACGAQRFSAREVKLAIADSDCFRDTLAEARSAAQTQMASR